MTEYYPAKVLDISEIQLGSELARDHVVGETVIEVYDVDEFDNEGGQIEIADVQYTYLSWDDDELDGETLTLTSGLTLAAEQGEQVWAYPITTEKEAMVEVEGQADDAVMVRVPHHLYDALDSIIREGVDQESVLLKKEDEDDWVIHDVIGEVIQRDGSYIDVSTLPDLSGPVVAPTVSPEVAVVGMPNTIFLRTEPVEATTAIRYEASYDGVTWAAYPDTPIFNTVYIARSMPDGTAFAPDVDYFFRVWATNVIDDAAAPSDTQIGRLDLNAVKVAASQVISEEVIAGFLLAGKVKVGGENFILRPPNPAEGDAGGMTIRLSNGGVIDLPADGSDATITANLTALSLDITNGADINGISRLGGDIIINASVPDPAFEPSTADFWDQPLHFNTFTFADGQDTLWIRGLCRTIDNDGWVFLRRTTAPHNHTYIYKVLDSAPTALAVTRDLGVDSSYTDVKGLAVGQASYVGSVAGDKSYYVCLNDSSNPTFARLDEYKPDLTTGGTVFVSGISPQYCTVGESAGRSNLLLAWSVTSGTNRGRARLYTPVPNTLSFTAGTLVTLDTTPTALIYSGCYFGPADVGSDRIWVTSTASNVSIRAYSTVGVIDLPHTFPRAGGSGGSIPRGLAWSTLDSRFWSMDYVGNVTKYAPYPSPATQWWSYDWGDSDTHRTGPSPEAEFDHKARAYIFVAAAPAPQVSLAGTHVANRIQFYAAATAGGSKDAQGSRLSVGVTGFIFGQMVPSATHPIANNWAGVSVTGRIISSASDSIGNIIELEGQGEGRVGPLIWDNAAQIKEGSIGTLWELRSTSTASIATAGAGETIIGWAVTGNSAVLIGGMASALAGGIITVSKAGVYLINASISFASNTTGRRIVRIYKNGLEYDRNDVGSGGGATPSITTLVPLAVGDTVHINGYQSSGAGLALAPAGDGHLWQLALVAPNWF